MFVLKDPIRGVINYLIKGTKINGDLKIHKKVVIPTQPVTTQYTT